MAHEAGLKVFDRIYQIDEIEISDGSRNFQQIVELLKGDRSKHFIDLEVARFEEPNCSMNKVLTCQNQHSPEIMKENEHLHVKATKTMSSVAVQTLPCLNPWFLADIRTNSHASVRTLKNSSEISMVKREIDGESKEEVTNFEPPTAPTFDLATSSGETLVVPSEPNDKAPTMREVASRQSELTVSSGKTWRTSSSSITASSGVPLAPDDRKSLASEISFSTNSLATNKTNKDTNHNETDDQNNFQQQQPMTMYTNSQNLAHTIRIQQHLFMQNESSRRSLASCPSSPGVVLTNEHDNISLNDSVNSSNQRGNSADAGKNFKWVVKVKSDGTRRIVKKSIDMGEDGYEQSPGKSDHQHHRKEHKKHRHRKSRSKYEENDNHHDHHQHHHHEQVRTPKSEPKSTHSTKVLAVTTV